MESALAETIAPTSGRPTTQTATPTTGPAATPTTGPATAAPQAGRIVVGVDGSPSARRALEWAMDEAQRRHGRCRVIEIWPHGASGMADPTSSRESLEKQLAALVDDVCSKMGVNAPVDVELQLGDPIEVLSAAARDADLIVVGTRGHGALRDLFAGSVSADLLHLGTCPTIVIPPNATIHTHHQRIVVGVDGSDEATRALRWARDEALLRHCELVVVHAWRMPVVMGSLYAPTIAIPFEECRHAGQEFLDQTVSHLESGADLNVIARLVEGVAEHELVKTAGNADLLVVGSRGRNAMAATVLGSASRGCIIHAPCPVAVIP
jgi:nucleotide-binding universal stress UspA family protein